MKFNSHVLKKNTPPMLTIIVISISSIIFYSFFNLNKMFYSGVISGLEVTNTQYGFLLSLYGLACIISYIPGGLLGDRIPARRLLVSSLTSVSILLALCLFCHRYPFLCCVFFCYGLTAGLLFWSCRYKVVRLAQKEEDKYARNICRSYLISSIFAICFNFLLSILSEYLFSGTNVFTVLILSIIVSNICLIFVVLTHIPYFENEIKQEKTGLRDAFQSMLATAKNPIILLASFIMFFIYFLYSIQYVTNIYLESTQATAIAIASFGILRTYGTSMISAPVYGLLTKRYFSLDLILKSSLLLLPFFSAITILQLFNGKITLTIMIALMLLAGFLINGTYNVTSALVVESHIPPSEMASAIGLFSFIGFLPDMFVPAAVGVVLDTQGDRSFTILFAGMIIIILIILTLILLFKKIQTKQHEQ